MADLETEVIEATSYQSTVNHILLATIALVLYEYIVTFSTEVQLFWGRKITGATVLFFLNRYMKLLDVLLDLELYSHFTGTTSACGGYIETLRVLQFLDYIPCAAFSALRVFALTGRNWFLPPVVFVLSLGPVAINFANFGWATPAINPISGCVESIRMPMELFFGFIATSRGSLILSDLIVIFTTWYTTYKTAIASRQVLNQSHPTFSGLLLRDGTSYFITMVSINVLHLAFSLSPVLMSANNGGFSNMTQFSDPLSSILISRFMMNLQEAKQRTSGSIGASGSISLVQFDRVIGSIGESLGPSLVEHLEDDEVSE